MSGKLTCSFPGCNKLRMMKETRRGKKLYRLTCQSHRPGKKSSHRLHGLNKCQLCLWEGTCHRHRIRPGSNGGEYVPENILVLCPNCHSAAHDRGNWNSQQLEPVPVPKIVVLESTPQPAPATQTVIQKSLF